MDVQLDNITFSQDKHTSSWPFIFGKINMLSNPNNRELLLKNIDLQICPGETLIVYGNNNQSLHALVKIAALRQTKGYLEGNIYFDTVNRDSGLYRDIAYIPEQEDTIHFDKLRVFEILYYSARLRTQQSEIECRERARETARFLDLDGSGFVEQLSATEKRILSIGIEVYHF
jgi:ABC-type multidrug transport system ATPase subunit